MRLGGIRLMDKNTWGCLFALCILVPVAQARVGSGEGIVAITRPSADVTLSFVQPGRIAKVDIKEGESVKAGQVLTQQDDAVERARLAQLEAESKNTTNIEAGKASLAQKRVDLQKLETAASRHAATELEVEHAKLDVKIAELSLAVAIFEQEQAIRKYDEAKLQIDNMSLKSPIDGSIEKVDVETGESVNALESVVQVVQIDPLWIDVPVPMTQISSLKPNGIASIAFSGSDALSVEGKIIFIASIADAGSGTIRVRLEVPNKMRRPAGEHVTVVFPSS